MLKPCKHANTWFLTAQYHAKNIAERIEMDHKLEVGTGGYKALTRDVEHGSV